MIVSFDDTCTYLWHPIHGWTMPSRLGLDAFVFTDDVALYIADKLNAITLTLEEVRDTLK